MHVSRILAHTLRTLREAVGEDEISLPGLEGDPTF
jgi:hypothetical protein